MSEPTSALTFRQLITRVARKSGMAYYGSSGTDEALPPIDKADLELLKDVVNDGIRMFIADGPSEGWRWTRRIMSVTLATTRVTGTVDSATDTTLVDATLSATYDSDDDLNDWYCYILTGTGKGSYAKITDYTTATGTCTVADWLDKYGNAGGTNPATGDTFAITNVETVEGDKARYPLNENFSGEYSGDITYEASSAHSTQIRWVHESVIRQRRSCSVSSGFPKLAAIRPLEYTDENLGPTRRWELFIDPQSNSAEVLEFPYELMFDKLDCECGVVDSATDTTIVDATRGEADDYFNGWVITIIAGTGKGSYAAVTDYTAATGTFTVADWLKPSGAAGGTNPGANSIYYVEPANNKHPAGVRFDHAILAAVMAQAEMDIEDMVESAGFIEKYVQKALPMAHLKDSRTGPRRLGSSNTRGTVRRERSWADVTTDHDV